MATSVPLIYLVQKAWRRQSRFFTRNRVVLRRSSLENLSWDFIRTRLALRGKLRTIQKTKGKQNIFFFGKDEMCPPPWIRLARVWSFPWRYPTMFLTVLVEITTSSSWLCDLVEIHNREYTKMVKTKKKTYFHCQWFNTKTLESQVKRKTS